MITLMVTIINTFIPQLLEDVGFSWNYKRFMQALIEGNGCLGEYAQDNCSCII